MAHLPLPFQTAGSREGAGDLRAVSAAVRLELVACVAGHVAARTDCAADGAGAVARRYGCLAVGCGQSVSACAAAPGARRALAISVPLAAAEARHGHVVAAGTTRSLRPDPGARSGWKNYRARMARNGTSRIVFFYCEPVFFLSAAFISGVTRSRCFSNSGNNPALFFFPTSMAF